MAQQHGRICIWKDSDERALLDGFAHVLPNLPDPGEVTMDRFKRKRILEPATSPYNQRWVTDLTLIVHRRHFLQFTQVFSGGAWVNDTIVFLDWLYARTVTARPQLVIYVEGHGVKGDGTERITKRFYKGWFAEELPPWINGDMMGSPDAPVPSSIALRFIVDVDNGGEGTFSDFNLFSGQTARTP